MENARGTAVIVDSYPLWLDALEPLLERVGLSVVGRAVDSAHAVELVREFRPDVLVTDYTIAADGAGDREERTASLRLVAEAIAANPDVKAIVLSNRDDPGERERAFASHAMAYCSRQVLPDDLAAAIRQALSPSIHLAQTARFPVEPVPPIPDDIVLTRREQEILRLAAEGYSNLQLAKMLWVTEQTVKFHLSNIYRKLGVANRTEASRWAARRGLLGDIHPRTPAAA